MDCHEKTSPIVCTEKLIAKVKATVIANKTNSLKVFFLASFFCFNRFSKPLDKPTKLNAVLYSSSFSLSLSTSAILCWTSTIFSLTSFWYCWIEFSIASFLSSNSKFTEQYFEGRSYKPLCLHGEVFGWTWFELWAGRNQFF